MWLARASRPDGRRERGVVEVARQLVEPLGARRDELARDRARRQRAALARSPAGGCAAGSCPTSPPAACSRRGTATAAPRSRRSRSAARSGPPPTAAPRIRARRPDAVDDDARAMLLDVARDALQLPRQRVVLGGDAGEQPVDLRSPARRGARRRGARCAAASALQHPLVRRVVAEAPDALRPGHHVQVVRARSRAARRPGGSRAAPSPRRGPRRRSDSSSERSSV